MTTFKYQLTLASLILLCSIQFSGCNRKEQVSTQQKDNQSDTGKKESDSNLTQSEDKKRPANKGGTTPVRYDADKIESRKDPITGEQTVAGELIVTLHEGVKKSDLEKSLEALPGNSKILAKIGDTDSYVVSCPKDSANEFRIRLDNHPYIASCGLNTIRTLNLVFNDPSFNSNNETDWNIKRINAPQAWDITTGGAPIAIVDSGIQSNHEEFAGKISNPFSVYTNSSRMQTGKVRERFFNEQGQPFYQENFITNHGTHVAATAAGLADNSKGTSGISPSSPVMPIQVLTFSNRYQRINATSDQPLLAGLHRAIDQGAKVINYSIGGPPPEQLLKPWREARSAADKARAEAVIVERFVKPNLQNFRSLLDKAQRNKVIFVKSAGNDNLPAKFDYLSYSGRVISVAATNKQDGRAIFNANVTTSASNYGQYTTVSAPGQEIWNAVSGATDSYSNMQGTSMAAPHVAGVIGLMKTIDPELSAEEAAEILISTGRRLNTDQPIGPLVNAEAALKELRRRRANNTRRPPQPPPLIPNPPIAPPTPRLPRDGIEICRGPKPWTNYHVRRLIDLWLCIAIPIVERRTVVTERYFCDRFGRIVTVRTMITLGPPKYASYRYRWLWENGRTLRSSNYGTLYGFVFDMMKSGTFDPVPPPKDYKAPPPKKTANVIRTLEYHQITDIEGNIHNHEGAHFGFNGETIAYGFSPKGKREGEVWTIPFSGGKPTLLHRYPKDFKGPGWPVSGMVDISTQAPYYVIHSNSDGYLGYIPIDKSGRPKGKSKRIYAANRKATITDMKASKVPYVLIRGPGERIDHKAKEKMNAGVYKFDFSGNATAVLTIEQVASMIGCKPAEIYFGGGSRFHFDVSLDGRVIATVHCYPKNPNQKSLYGSYVVTSDGGGSAKIIHKDPKQYSTPRVAISPNGKKVAYVKQHSGEVIVANFDGSNSKVVCKRDDKRGFPDSVSPIQFSQDAKFLLNGAGGFVINTENATSYCLGNSPRTYAMMSYTLNKVYMGKEPNKFVFLTAAKKGHQLATVEINASKKDARTPYITSYELEPMALPAYGGQHVISRAWVPFDPAKLKDVRTSGSLNGFIDRQIYFAATRDNGNKAIGDIKGDGIYSDVRYALGKDIKGTRVMRIDAEAIDDQGMRHAYAIEFGPVEIKKIETEPHLEASPIELK